MWWWWPILFLWVTLVESGRLQPAVIVAGLCPLLGSWNLVTTSVPGLTGLYWKIGLKHSRCLAIYSLVEGQLIWNTAIDLSTIGCSSFQRYWTVTVETRTDQLATWGSKGDGLFQRYQRFLDNIEQLSVSLDGVYLQVLTTYRGIMTFKNADYATKSVHSE